MTTDTKPKRKIPDVLSDAWLRFNTPPEAKPYIVTDGNDTKKGQQEGKDYRGLYLEVLPSGTKSWRYRYLLNGRQEKVTLYRKDGLPAHYPEVGLADARALFKVASEIKKSGESPARKRQKARRLESGEVLVKVYLEKWYQDVLSKARKNPAGLRYWLVNDVLPAIGNKPMNEVSRDDLRRLIFDKADGGSPAAAGKIRGLLNQMFDHALHRGIIEINPVAAIPAQKVFKQKPRDRALSADEVRLFLAALDASNLHPGLIAAFKILLLTLTRKGELLNARWKDINFDAGEWKIPKENSKTKTEHIVYLSHQAAALFEELKPLAAGSALVLPGRDLNRPLSADTLNKALQRLNLPIESFNPHDLRRSAATLLGDGLNYEPHLIDAALNHAIGKAVTVTYNRSKYREARRDMLQHWADFLDGLTQGAKIIPLHQKRA